VSETSRPVPTLHRTTSRTASVDAGVGGADVPVDASATIDLTSAESASVATESSHLLPSTPAPPPDTTRLSRMSQKVRLSDSSVVQHCSE
jgi:hypothetical protein